MRISFTSCLTRTRHFVNGLVLSVGFLPAVMAPSVHATQISSAIMSDYTAGPVTTVESVTPEVMLAMSRDHQYFFKAYNDYSDVDSDGVVETTYDDTFGYYGYFHSELCYRYDDADARFEPVSTTDGTANKHYCTGSSADAWSGNFLNWASMARMDIVRKILYGGKRSTDTASLTVLERANLPTDAHSFAKYYNGDDLDKLTPYDTVRTDDLNGGNGDDVDDADEGITLCSTTFSPENTNSQTTTSPPLLRVVSTNRQLWGANERWQCTWEDPTSGNDREGRNDDINKNQSALSGINAGDSDPFPGIELQTPGGSRDHIVRVVVCDSTLFNTSNNLENCKRYPSTNLKPTGLLQRYGETGLINFGLITGSWEKNISGGVLRKNTGTMTDEINTTTNGTFKSPPAAGNIIGMLDKMRIWGYDYGANGNSGGTYFGDDSQDNCNFQLTGITEGRCAAWGNPISEIYLEALRYYAVSSGRNPTAAFNANDSGYFTGMPSASWAVDPLDIDNACASLNVVTFNASINSYDNDQTGSAIFGGNTAAALTDVVGAGEGIHGNQWFIGKTGAATDEVCTPKTITSLGDSFGLCPEGPTLDGSFHMAGMAHYARTNDMRTDLSGDQEISTFAVALATNVPAIVAPIGPVGTAETVNILPGYRLLLNPQGAGALVDFKVVRKHTEVNAAQINAQGQPTVLFPTEQAGTGFFHGKFYINWEDSEQGGDYDQDLWGMLDYVVNTNVSPATITVTTDVIAESTVNGQLFGFVTSGTTEDGFHAYSGIENGDYTAEAHAGVPRCNNCNVGDAPVSHTFTVSNAPAAGLLENPLYYAAKWGGFNDTDDDDTPNLQKEWDVRDQNGAFVGDLDGDGTPDGDGVPDNFFFVSNPAALEDSLSAVFDIIIERVSSGTAAAVVANDQEGIGAVFQALYDPIKSDSTVGQNEVQWIGTLHALWVDPQGLIREDNDQDGKLDGYNVDKVVEIFFDDVDRRSKIRRFASSDPLNFDPVDLNPAPLELTELQTIWNARERLSDLDNATIENQRAYDTVIGPGANAGRHILTWVDDDFNNIVDVSGSETVSFDTTTFGLSNRHRWLDDDDTAVTDNLINWIRGKEIAGLRERIVDYDNDNAGGAATHSPSGNPEVMRLGDIIHSTPIPVATPIEAFDLLSLDTSYADFRQKYINRRQVVYIGGNDGMIHAFNGGFFDAVSKEFKLSLSGEAPHPLGTELWAYIPKNLLPYLQFLARPDYSHVYYMDQTARVFDAKIFTPSTTHVNGWGTVLVMGMRFGGGNDTTAISLDIDNDATTDATMKSALVILDITDPESPPEVLAELSPPGLNFTTSFPQVVIVGDPIEPGSVSTTSSPNKWYLVFGSGPTELGTAESTQRGRLYAYDLGDLAAGRSGLTSLDQAKVTSGPFAGGFAEVNENNTFIGDPVILDGDIDMVAESIYFGTVGDFNANDGSIWRINLPANDTDAADPGNWSSLTQILNPNKPFVSQPSITLDKKFRTWVLAGTGRLFVNTDKTSTNQQTLYGFLDPATPPVNIASLVDVTNAEVRTNGDVDIDDDGTVDTTFEGLQAQVDTAGGWKRNYTTNSPDPSQRSINRSTLIDGVLFNTAFTPSTDLCTSEGTSILLGLAFDTGTALPSPIFGEIPCAGCPTGVSESKPYVDLGAGLASTPSIHIGNQDIPGKVTVITQKSTGAIDTTEATTLGGIANGEISWREYRDF